MNYNPKTTSPEMARLASEVLRDNNASTTARQLAGSVLSQYNTGKQTGEDLETLASLVLRSEKYNTVSKQLAASVLSQSNKSR